MKTFRNIYTLGITIVVAIFVFDKCSPPAEGLEPGVLSRKVVKEVIRTHEEHFKDSLTTWVHHQTSLVPEIHDTEYINIYHDAPEMRYPEIDTNLNTYHYGKKDSTLRYSIKVFSECKPSHVELDYDVKNVTYRDSIYVRDSVFVEKIVKVRTNQLYYGIESIVYPGFKGAFAGIDYVSKKGWQAEASIGVAQFNEGAQPMIKLGLKKLITFRKK